MEIKLLNDVSWGGNKLAPVVDWAIMEMKLDCKFELIENEALLKELGIEKAPAMIINGEILIERRVPPFSEVKEILRKAILENEDWFS